MSRAALELIGQGAFGHSFDLLVQNVQNDYADAVKDFTFVYILTPNLRILTVHPAQHCPVSPSSV